MSMSTAELERFHQFALQKLQNDGADSLEELVGLWRATSPDSAELVASLCALEEGLADAAAGRVRPAENVFEKFIKRYDSDRWEPRDIALSGFAGALFGYSIPFLASILLVWLHQIGLRFAPENLRDVAIWLVGSPLAIGCAVVGGLVGVTYASRRQRQTSLSTSIANRRTTWNPR